MRQPVGRSCKRPETRQPTRFRRPGAQGCGDRLRLVFAKPRFEATSPGKTRRQALRTTPFWAAISVQRAGAARNNHLGSCPRARRGVFRGVFWEKKGRLKSLSPPRDRRHRRRPHLGRQADQGRAGDRPVDARAGLMLCSRCAGRPAWPRLLCREIPGAPRPCRHEGRCARTECFCGLRRGPDLEIRR